MSQTPHVERYLARLDAYLPTIPAEERRPFLLRQAQSWRDAYAAFVARVDAGLPTDPAVHAADYLVTMAEIDQRLAQLAKSERANPLNYRPAR
jgi:hypothetical protein